jgi:hypothetical protein
MPSPLEKVKQKASSVSIAQLLKQIPDIRGTDYDLEGYYADHGIPYKSLEDMALSHAITGAHYSDEGKLPWHPSFSTHSKYSDQDMEGGKWQQGGGEGSELWNFTPSEANMEYNSPAAYKRMWLENQPKGTFITLPSGDVVEGNERNYADGGSVTDKYASFKHNPLAFALGQGDEVRYADETSNKQYPNEGHNGRADALRHLLWQAKLQHSYGDIPATLAGKAHEMFSMSQPEAESEMDLYNNEIGLRLGKENKTDADILRKAIEAIDSGEAKILHGKQQEVMYAEGGSVEYNPITVDQIIDATHQELGTGRYADGGSVKKESSAIDDYKQLLEGQ